MRPLARKLIIAILLVIFAWGVVKCQCFNLKVLTPAALRSYITSFGRVAAIAYIVLYALNTVSIMPPVGPLSLAAGFIFGEVKGALYLMIATLIGTSAAFAISRYFGRALIERALKGKFKELDEKLAARGFATVLFLRLIPLVPYELLNYACGLSGVKFRDYFLATFLGLIPGVAIAAFFGASLGRIKGFWDIFTPKFLIASGLIIVIISVPVIYRFYKKNRVKHG